MGGLLGVIGRGGTGPQGNATAQTSDAARSHQGCNATRHARARRGHPRRTPRGGVIPTPGRQPPAWPIRRRLAMLAPMTPSSAASSPSLAARVGRWSTRHRRTAIAGWFVFVLIAVFAGSSVGTVHPSNDSGGHGDSARADRIVNDAYPDRADESVLIQSTAGHPRTAKDPEFRRTVADVVAGVARQPGVVDVQSPYAAGNGGQISKDGRSAMVSFKINGDSKLAEKRVGPVEDAVKAAADRHPSVYVGQFGVGQRRQGALQGLRRRLRQGRDAVGPGHAHHPRADVRRAGRRGRPAAAGPHRRRRHDRPARPDQPPRLARRLHQRGRAARRPGRRRRLLALLPAPRARGEGARASPKEAVAIAAAPRAAPCWSPA